MPPISALSANAEPEISRVSLVRMAGTTIDQDGEVAWIAAHEALSRLARRRAAADAEEGVWLLRAFRAAAHVHLGFGSFAEYVERLFGYRPRSTHEKLRVAEALEGLPTLKAALEAGQLSWSAARELTRVAVRTTEGEWLELGVGKSLRQLEELVAGKRVGDRPSTAPDPALQRHVLRFEVSAETFALFREAMAELRRRCDTPLDDDSALLELARHVLGGPSDEGRSSYQISLSVCPTCATGQQSANGQLISVSPDVIEMARCDAQQLPSKTPDGAHVGTRATRDIPPAVRRAVLHRDQHRCRIPGCRNAVFLDLHHLQSREDGGRHGADNLIAVCSAHHRALHRGRLQLDGDSANLRVRHSDRNAYGQPVSARAVDVQTQVFAGLRKLGFREGEVRRAMAELQQIESLAAATPQEWLRAALQRLRPSRPG